jgi:hypothetical protein
MFPVVSKEIKMSSISSINLAQTSTSSNDPEIKDEIVAVLET